MEARLNFFGVLLLILNFFSVSAKATILGGELSTPGSMHSLLTHEKEITVEIGLEFLHPDLPMINNIIVENGRTSTSLGNGATRKSDVNNNYPDTFAQTLKAQMLLDPESNFTIALKTYLPLNGLTQLDTGNTYQPEYVLYRSEGQRPRVLLMSGMNLNPDWRAGVGLDVGFSVTAEANVFLQSGASSVSDQRISAKIKPSFVPQASLAYRNFELAVRGENKAEMNLSTNASARIFAGNAGVDFAYNTQSSLFYQPWQFELNGKSPVSASLALKYGLSYELWSGYQPRAAIIQSNIPVNCPSGTANCEPQFSSGLAPSYKAKNIFIPEAGTVFTLGNNALEIGYRYKDSIFEGAPTGTGNYLDPSRHDLLLGFTHPTLKGWVWSIHAQISRLNPQTVVKSDPAYEIGGPGYEAKGWLYGGGISVAIPFKN